MGILRAAGLVALVTASPAFAGDPPIKAPATAAAFSWTGCYMGAHIGGAVSQDTLTVDSGGSSNFSSNGFTGGGQIGCDYQFATGWVVGGEGRVAGSTMKYSNSGRVRTSAGDHLTSRLTINNDVLASITARIGYRIADRWLGYVRGGAAVTHETSDVAFTTTDGLSFDPQGFQTRTGWTVGGGFDWAFAQNWSANIEYNYYDFGGKELTAKVISAGKNVIASEGSVKDTMHAVTAGVNYHF